jgi:phosphoribosylformylglycinamidine synthase
VSLDELSEDYLEQCRVLGLSGLEAEEIFRLLGRVPTQTEIALFSVMWSEHCSYKSSRRHLSRFPTKAPWVLVGPGENAGVVSLGNGLALAVRMESHNHPSAIEPHQGAATGVGGILRDILSMGARPIAVADALYTGDPMLDERSRFLLEGIVSGISHYGNAVGVPTVAGELWMDQAFAGNPLVNVVCLGLLNEEDLVLARAPGAGNLAVLLGSTTGRDGIGGVSLLASSGFADQAHDKADAEHDAKRPSVQVGDPFEEKRLIEACLLMVRKKLVVGVQDLGGAGLVCATSETAAKAGMGMEVRVSAVATREPGMTPAEIMTSESQERMLAIVEPSRLKELEDLCEEEEVRCQVVGTVVPAVDGRGWLQVIDDNDQVVARVPAGALADGVPFCERPAAEPRAQEDQVPGDDVGRHSTGSFWSDASWVWRQYDHQLFLNTIVGPGKDAAVLRARLPGQAWGPGGRAISLSVDGNPSWCQQDPMAGSAMVVAESALNVACSGARPLALVNCLNFGNPEHPEVMWQLIQCIEGISRACEALGIPVVGGNVSLYNERAGRNIPPTPVVATVGVIDSLQNPPPGMGLLLGGKIYAAGRLGEAGRLLDPAWRPWMPNWELHRRLLDLVASLVNEGLLVGIHDVSAGGLVGCVAEMAVASGLGVVLEGTWIPEDLVDPGREESFPGYLYELARACQGPSIVCFSPAADKQEEVLSACKDADIPVMELGEVIGDRFVLGTLGSWELSEVMASRGWLSSLMDFPSWT